MTLDFRTENVDTDYYSGGGNGSGGCTVDWELEFETRQHCLKSIAFIVKKVVGTISIDGQDDIEIDTTDEKWRDWSIESEVKFDDDGACCPNNVSIDAKDKTIAVS